MSPTSSLSVNTSMPNAAAGSQPRPARISWRPCWRIIPTRYPPIQLFERVADPADLDALFEIEALTNDRLRDEVGELQLVPPEDRISGPNASVVMAPFTHIRPGGGRFNDGSFGAYYAGRELATAIAETRYHRAQFYAATNEAPTALDMRAYAADLTARLHDIRKLPATSPLYNPSDYNDSQAFARKLREQGSEGIAFDSVRIPPGQCVALFKPRLLSNIRQGQRLIYQWDGVHICEVFETTTLWQQDKK